MSKVRVPGVVSRLMGLESLPEGAYISSQTYDTSQVLHNTPTEPPPRELQLGPAPVMLHELLQQEFQLSKKSFRDKFSAFKKRGTGKKNPTPRHDLKRHGSSRTSVRSVKKAGACTPESEEKAITKLQPFLARLQTGASLPRPSNFSNSPLLSPSIIRGIDTLRLLEAAVKALEPNNLLPNSPRGRISPTDRESYWEITQSESTGGSSRSLWQTGFVQGIRGRRSANSSSRSFRSPMSFSRTSSGMVDTGVRGGHESVSLPSRSSKARRRAGRTRFEKNTGSVTSSARSVLTLQSPRSRATNSKRVKDSPPRALLGTNEASVRGFKTDLSNLIDSPFEALGRDFHPQFVEFEQFHSEKDFRPTPSPTHEHSSAMEVSSDRDQNEPGTQFTAAISETSPCMTNSVPEKPSIGRGRTIRFRSRSRKQEKDVGGQGNRVFPSDKQVELPPTKEAKVGGAGFSFSLLFSRKHRDKIQGGNGEGDSALVAKQLDSAPVKWSLLKWTSKTSKSRAQTEVNNMGPVEGKFGNQDVSPQDQSAWTPTLKQLENPTKAPSIVQARCRSVDDVFPELPMEEKDASGGASPDLVKTIHAVESKFLGFESSQSDEEDCQDYIERMFGKFSFSRTNLYVESAAPEISSNILGEFATESSGVPGTFPYSPAAKDEGTCFFSSQNHFNLQEIIEGFVSGDRQHDSTGRRRSFRLSEPGKRTVLDDEETKAESDTCSHSDAVIAKCLEIQRIAAAAEWSIMDAKTPPALKKFEEKLAQGFSDLDDSHVPCGDECGQPSPVSVLQSTFLEVELAPTAPNASPAELEQADNEHLNESKDDTDSTCEIEDDEGQTEESNEQTTIATSNIFEAVLPEAIEKDMIERAILQISRSTRNIDVSSTNEFEAPSIEPAEPRQEQNYIREALTSANLPTRDREYSRSWCFAESSPMNRSSFDRPVEVGSGMILRSEGKLLFDSVNEVMAMKSYKSLNDIDLPMFPDLHLNSELRLPISSEALVIEVHRRICQWRDIAGNALDDLLDYDMTVPEGRWINFAHEAAHVGLQIERALLKGVIKEIVDDLISISSTRALRIS